MRMLSHSTMEQILVFLHGQLHVKRNAEWLRAAGVAF